MSEKKKIPTGLIQLTCCNSLFPFVGEIQKKKNNNKKYNRMNFFNIN